MTKILNSLVLILLLTVLLGGGTFATPDLVAVVSESSESIPPPYGTGALKQLADEGLHVRVFDQDVVTGEGEVPDPVKAAITAATSPLPSLVVLSGGVVISAQPLPGTAQEIIEAVR